jgi:hypothetical protein
LEKKDFKYRRGAKATREAQERWTDGKLSLSQLFSQFIKKEGKEMKTKGLMSVLILISVLLAVALPAAYAEEASAGMRDILVENTGKRVALRLASGEEIEGTVTIVGNFLVHISKLSGKEFYDAVVSIDKISAVRMKMRDN